MQQALSEPMQLVWEETETLYSLHLILALPGNIWEVGLSDRAEQTGLCQHCGTAVALLHLCVCTESLESETWVLTQPPASPYTCYIALGTSTA